MDVSSDPSSSSLHIGNGIFPEYDLKTDWDNDDVFGSYLDTYSLDQAYGSITNPDDDEIIHHQYMTVPGESSDRPSSSKHSLSSVVLDLITSDKSTSWSHGDISKVEQILRGTSTETDHDYRLDNINLQKKLSTTTRQRIQAGFIQYDPIRLTVDGITPYWQTLHSSPGLKSDLITRYCELSTIKGRPLDRNLAAKRLRARCNEQIAEDLLSREAVKEQSAKRAIDRPAKRILAFLSPSETAIACRLLVDQHHVAPLLAPKLVNLGCRLLGDKKRKFYSSIKMKDPATMIVLTRDIHKALTKHSEKDVELGEQDDLTIETDTSIGSCTIFWGSLSDIDRQSLVRKYAVLGKVDPENALYILETRCSHKVASALLSENPDENIYAIAVLNKIYKREGELLTEDEKSLFYQYLAHLYHLHGDNKYRVYTLGSRGLQDEAKIKIREDVRMDSDRFISLTKLLYETYKQVRRKTKA